MILDKQPLGGRLIRQDTQEWNGEKRIHRYKMYCYMNVNIAHRI